MRRTLARVSGTVVTTLFFDPLDFVKVPKEAVEMVIRTELGYGADWDDHEVEEAVEKVMADAREME